MSGHFNVKSLSFYGIAIGFVVTLFSFVSAYGEKSLTAPPVISGSYPIAASDLPECLRGQSLVLHVQQSGTYVSANLKPSASSKPSASPAKEKHPLSGRFTNQQVTLAGLVPDLPSCQSQNSDRDRPTSANVRGEFADKTLQGEIQLSSIPQAIAFTAKQQAEKPTDFDH